MSNELIPCPGCGNNGDELPIQMEQGEKWSQGHVCRVCGFGIKTTQGEEESRKRWNHRVLLPEVREVLEAILLKANKIGYGPLYHGSEEIKNVRGLLIKNKKGQP